MNSAIENRTDTLQIQDRLIIGPGCFYARISPQVHMLGVARLMDGGGVALSGSYRYHSGSPAFQTVWLNRDQTACQSSNSVRWRKPSAYIENLFTFIYRYAII